MDTQSKKFLGINIILIAIELYYLLPIAKFSHGQLLAKTFNKKYKE